MIEPKLIRTILTGYTLPVMGLHGLPHWGRVMDIGLRIAEKTGATRNVVALFAVFHDSRRESEGIDPDHGRRGAALAAELRGRYFDLPDGEFELLQYACAHHTDGMTEADVTIQTCWDSDRLDLWRIGITPRSELLCTDAAKSPQLRAWARDRSVAEYVPPYVTGEWLKRTRAKD